MRLLVPAILLATVACARASSRAAPDARPPACYRADSSIIYPIGDLRSSHLGKKGAWLVLRQTKRA